MSRKITKKTFDKHIGVKLIAKKRGYARFKLILKPHHLNEGGIAHGGILATLCDISLAGALGSLLKKEERCLTAELDIHFINPAFPTKPIYGFGKVIRKGKNVAFMEGGIETQDKTTIVKAKGIWVIKTKLL